MFPGQFSVWQPLEGGVVFVMLQGFGWILYSAATLLCWIVLANYNALRVDTLRGILTTIVLLSLLSHVGLSVSVNYFEAGAAPTAAGRAFFGFLRNGKAFVSALLSVAGTIIFVAVDFDVVRAFSFAPTLKIIGCACFVVAAFTTHVLEGAYGTRGYRVYQPMVGGTPFVALQACSWSVFAIFLNLTLAIPNNQPVPFGYMCLTALLGFLSQVFLQASIVHFDPRKRGFTFTRGGSTEQRWSNYSIVAIVTAVLALLYLLVVASDSHHLGARHLLKWLLPEAGNQKQRSAATVTPPYPYRTVVIGNLILFSCAPYVQICAWLQKEHFSCVPSMGGASFLLYQAFGWAFYLLACLMLPLYAAMPLREAILAVTPIAFTSQVLVTVSVSQFDAHFGHRNRQRHRSSAGDMESSDGRPEKVGGISDRLAHFDASRSASLLLAIIASVLLVSLDVLDFFDLEQIKYVV